MFSTAKFYWLWRECFYALKILWRNTFIMLWSYKTLQFNKMVIIPLKADSTKNLPVKTLFSLKSLYSDFEHFLYISVHSYLSTCFWIKDKTSMNTNWHFFASCLYWIDSKMKTLFVIKKQWTRDNSSHNNLTFLS